MNLIDELKCNSTILNTKGSKYYVSTYNSNLNVFTMLTRYASESEIIRLFNNALNENTILALSNLLYILDIRNGKGERRLFKIIFKYLCLNHKDLALQVLPYISKLGRYDYILVGLDTPINNEVISLIKEQLNEDLVSNNPSLLAKWLPSHRTHNMNNKVAKKIMNSLNMTEKEYRKTLSILRSKINIIEKNLTNKEYDNIDFNEIPTKAMLKYINTFMDKMSKEYQKYKEELKNSNAKINTNGLYVYEIIKRILNGKGDSEIFDLMWKNQRDVLNGCKTNVLVMADTSGSMTYPNNIPYATSIGLALYTAERNNGIFKNHFMTFSDEPYFQEIKGNTIEEKVNNIPCYVANTDIDKAFELLLNTAKENNINESEMPSHLLIISDMEFDAGVYSKTGTNFKGWKKAFKDVGYKLPKIVFWNVAGSTHGVPITKYDKDAVLISGFSTNVLDNILTIEKYDPYDVMLNKLSVYIEMLTKRD